jgi:hypothetical protein
MPISGTVGSKNEALVACSEAAGYDSKMLALVHYKQAHASVHPCSHRYRSHPVAEALSPHLRPFIG